MTNGHRREPIDAERTPIDVAVRLGTRLFTISDVNSFGGSLVWIISLDQELASVVTAKVCLGLGG